MNVKQKFHLICHKTIITLTTKPYTYFFLFLSFVLNSSLHAIPLNLQKIHFTPQLVLQIVLSNLFKAEDAYLYRKPLKMIDQYVASIDVCPHTKNQYPSSI